ncbi:MAG: hypothetical protein Q9165_004298 [Trypethelium subeluteriae]
MVVERCALPSSSVSQAFELIQPSKGRHTGTTELPLTANGERRMRATGKALVGDDRLIVPRNLTSPEQVTGRLDALIADIRARFHGPALSKPQTAPSGTVAKDAAPSDVLVVAHGHILRAFAARWIGKNIAENPSLILEAGGVGTLRTEEKKELER